VADPRECNGDRREFLRLAWTVAAGLAVPAGISGCGPADDSGGDLSPPLPPETFVEPLALSSVGGVLDVTLKLAYLRTTLDGKAVTLRNMFGSIPAPTLRVDAGDTLRILVQNELPPNPPSTEPVTHLRYPNSTNLHVHGLHVTPGFVSAGVYGDYVMDDPQLGIQPGQSRQHEYRIGRDHPPGAYWYHPHLHGSSSIQVGSGMAGALLVKGDVDRVPEIAAAVERVFMFQAPITDAEGRLESFTQTTRIPTVEPPFLINGVRRPRLVMQRGEVQNWHFVNASIFKFVNLCLDGHALNVHGLDGNPRANLLPVGPFAMPAPAGTTGVVLAPANRASVLVQAGAPGTYYLRTLRFETGIDESIVPEDILAEVVVVDPPRAMALPAAPLPVPASLAPITDEELAGAGGLKRNIVLRFVSFNPANPPAPGGILNPGTELNDWVYRTDNTAISNAAFAIGAASGQASPAPGMPDEYIPYQSSRALKQTVALGSVEEWTIFNMNNVRHPFHIHVNPFEVVRINGQPVERYWADTIALPPGGTAAAPTSVTIRTRFRDFSGAFVMHCHMLVHEDMGMMQVVEVV
jgi:FtsP/CotA-like multicopper oxidase with cupredoxin domain